MGLMGRRSVQPTEAPGQGARTAEPRPTFAEIYESCFSFVWRATVQLGTPQASVDDLVQEIFMIAYRRQNEFEGRSSLKTWLYGIVFNVARAHRRELRSKHPQALEAQAPPDPDLIADAGPSPDERTARREAGQFLERFLDDLDDDRRAVFVLAELEQLSAPEIAAVVDAPLNTVYSRLRLARAEFSKAVARHRARDSWRDRTP